MNLLRFSLAIVGCAIMATCSYNRGFDGSSSYTGGVDFELPTGGYNK